MRILLFGSVRPCSYKRFSPPWFYSHRPNEDNFLFGQYAPECGSVCESKTSPKVSTDLSCVPEGLRTHNPKVATISNNFHNLQSVYEDQSSPWKRNRNQVENYFSCQCGNLTMLLPLHPLAWNVTDAPTTKMQAMEQQKLQPDKFHKTVQFEGTWWMVCECPILPSRWLSKDGKKK